MKSLLIVLLAVAATAKHQRCEPNAVFKEYCNTCRCGPTGEFAACTLMYCDPAVWNKDGSRKSESMGTLVIEEPEQQVCEPGTTYKDYCNTCHCSKDGRTTACTMMACDPSVWNKDGSRKVRSIEQPSSTSEESDERTCEPRSVFKDYCNTCRCGPDGKVAGCTYMYCDPDIWNSDGTRKTRSVERRHVEESNEYEQDCDPRSRTFKYYCNTCTCGPDGKIGACTAMYCDPASWNRDGSPKSKAIEAPGIDRVCEPGTTFRDYCNICHCSKDGRNAVCTLMACDPRVWNKDGTLKNAHDLSGEINFGVPYNV